RGRTVSVVVSLGKDRIVVPDVGNDTVPRAEAALQARGLHYLTRQRASDTVKRNRVIATKPAAGSKVKRDKVVTIVISSGPPVLSIPEVETGTPYDQAAQTLRAAHFQLKK